MTAITVPCAACGGEIVVAVDEGRAYAPESHTDADGVECRPTASQRVLAQLRVEDKLREYPF